MVFLAEKTANVGGWSGILPDPHIGFHTQVIDDESKCKGVCGFAGLFRA